MMHDPQNGAINCFGCRGYIYILEVYRSSASGSASADIRMNFDIRILIRIRNISCGCHADIANNKRIIFSYS